MNDLVTDGYGKILDVNLSTGEIVKKAGWVGALTVLVPIGIMVWNEYEDWVKWKHQAELIMMEREQMIAW